MFTGIVQTVGEIVSVEGKEALSTFGVRSDFLAPLVTLGSSVSVNGVCLTVTRVDGDILFFDAVLETLERTSLGDLSQGSHVNLEPALLATGRLDGHIVQGHVDTVASVLEVSAEGDNRMIRFGLDEATPYIVEKGSICIQGVSLTAFGIVNGKEFQVVVVPHTWENTTFSSLSVGTRVNIEFDILGKYILNTVPSSHA